MGDSVKPTYISVSVATILKIFGLALLAFLLYYLRDLVLVIATAVVMAAAIEPLAKMIAGNKLPRVVAVLIVYILFFLVFFSVVYFLVPPIFQDLSVISSSLPQKINSLGGSSVSVDPLSSVTGGLAKSITLQQLVTEAQKNILTMTDSIFNATSVVFGGAQSFILILVISFYLVVQERGVDNFLALIIPYNKEDYVIDLWHRSKNKIGKWLQGQIILSLIMGLLVFLGLSLLQVKYAFSLGILAATFEIIPFFGPILSAVPGVLVGLSDNVTLGLMVLGLYLIVHQFENHLLYPLVVKKIIGVNPLVVIIALIVGVKLAGFLGLILAVPLTTALMEFVGDIEKKKALSKSQRETA